MTLEPNDQQGSVVTPPGLGLVRAILTGLLGIAALITVGYWGWRGFQKWDTEAMESPLIMSVARQLAVSPSELYGPFGGTNPLVLIHAPLYYRLAGFAALPLSRGGMEVSEAARIAGRSLSALSLLATLAIAYGLARLAGGSKLAGWWAVLLISAAPLLAGQPFAVRPDMLGIALQSAGLLLILSSLEGKARSTSRIIWGYACFGLALCVKQHLVVEAGICTLFLMWKSRCGGVPLATITRGLLVGALIVACVYGAEWVISGGEIWNSAFVAAGQVGKIYRGGIRHSGLLLYGMTRQESGLLALLSLIALTAVGSTRGRFGKLILVTGTALYGVILANFVLIAAFQRFDLEISAYFVALTSGLAFLSSRHFSRDLLDNNLISGILWLCLAAEIALTLLLAYLSTGSWFNYAIQAVVLGSVITARAGARVVEASSSPRALWPIALGVLAILISSYTHTHDAEIQRSYNQAAVEHLFDNLKQPPESFFFADNPGFNRINGRLDLVYDHWLYKVFETAHLAESRSGWIARAFQSRALRCVVTSSDQPVLEGTTIPLRSFGFRPSINVDRYYVWIR